MDVSQFLKSFKKNVAAKAKGSAAASATASTTEINEAEELSDLMHSDSDHEVDAQSSDYVVSGNRADKIGGKRYGAHQKHNQEFEALRVFNTNANRASEPGRMHRQRAIAAQQLKDSRRLPRAELVASVRAELLRQRAQLQSTRDAVSADVVAAPMEKVEATMVEVEDLLLQSAAQTSAATSTTAALLESLPPPVPSPATASGSPLAAVVEKTAQAVASGALHPATSSASDSRVTSPSRASAPPHSPHADAVSEKTVDVKQPAKKRSKFELAVALAKDDEDD